MALICLPVATKTAFFVSRRECLAWEMQPQCQQSDHAIFLCPLVDELNMRHPLLDLYKLGSSSWPIGPHGILDTLATSWWSSSSSFEFLVELFIEILIYQWLATMRWISTSTWRYGQLWLWEHSWRWTRRTWRVMTWIIKQRETKTKHNKTVNSNTNTRDAYVCETHI